MSEGQQDGQVEMQVNENEAHAAYANFARVTATPKKSSSISPLTQIHSPLASKKFLSTIG